MPKLEPTTDAALSVRLAFGSSRSIRALIAACRVAGTVTSATSASADVAAACSLEYPAFGQVAHDLLGEKRITGSPIGDRLAQPANRGVRPEQFADQC